MVSASATTACTASRRRRAATTRVSWQPGRRCQLTSTATTTTAAVFSTSMRLPLPGRRQQVPLRSDGSTPWLVCLAVWAQWLARCTPRRMRAAAAALVLLLVPLAVHPPSLRVLLALWLCLCRLTHRRRHHQRLPRSRRASRLERCHPHRLTQQSDGHVPVAAVVAAAVVVVVVVAVAVVVLLEEWLAVGATAVETVSRSCRALAPRHPGDCQRDERRSRCRLLLLPHSPAVTAAMCTSSWRRVAVILLPERESGTTLRRLLPQ